MISDFLDLAHTTGRTNLAMPVAGMDSFTAHVDTHFGGIVDGDMFAIRSWLYTPSLVLQLLIHNFSGVRNSWRFEGRAKALIQLTAGIRQKC